MSIPRRRPILTLVLVAAALAVVAAGCSRPSLVGVWRGTKPRGTATGTARLTLAQDRTYSLIVDIRDVSGMQLQQKASGTYTSDGRALDLKTTRITLEGMPLPVAPGGTRSRVPYRLDGDHLTLHLGGKDRLDLTRVRPGSPEGPPAAPKRREPRKPAPPGK